MNKVHTFDNGVKVFDDHISVNQKKRYAKMNIHEADEEELFINIINGLESNAIYVNIGTAIGYYPLLARKIRSDIKIHCYEPLPKHIEFFRENIKLNGWTESDFNFHDLAVSTDSGKVVFKEKSFGSSIVNPNPVFFPVYYTRKFLKLAMGRKNKKPHLFVKSSPLIIIFDLAQSETIDFVQMDIQGFEQEVLEKFFSNPDSRSKAIKSFLIGTHGNTIHTSCVNLFKENGYKIVIDDPDTKNQPDGIIYCKLN